MWTALGWLPDGRLALWDRREHRVEAFDLEAGRREILVRAEELGPRLPDGRVPPLDSVSLDPAAGVLWLGRTAWLYRDHYEPARVYRYDLQTGRTEPLAMYKESDALRPPCRPRRGARERAPEVHGGLRVATVGGCRGLLSASGDAFAPLPPGASDPRPLLAPDPDGAPRLWLADGEALVRVDPAAGAVVRHPMPPAAPVSGRARLHAVGGRVWVMQVHAPLAVLDPASGRWTRHPVVPDAGVLVRMPGHAELVVLGGVRGAWWVHPETLAARPFPWPGGWPLEAAVTPDGALWATAEMQGHNRFTGLVVVPAEGEAEQLHAIAGHRVSLTGVLVQDPDAPWRLWLEHRDGWLDFDTRTRESVLAPFVLGSLTEIVDGRRVRPEAPRTPKEEAVWAARERMLASRRPPSGLPDGVALIPRPARVGEPVAVDTAPGRLFVPSSEGVLEVPVPDPAPGGPAPGPD